MGDGGYARIKYDLVQDLIKQHGEGAYSYALQKMCHYEGDGFSQGMWRDVLKELDEYFKGEEQ
jgi:hypothetical protein